MPKYVTPPAIVAISGGLGINLLWVACEDGSIFRLTQAINPPDATTANRDPSQQWSWEKLPALPVGQSS
jgi:hypothetical protein